MSDYFSSISRYLLQGGRILSICSDFLNMAIPLFGKLSHWCGSHHYLLFIQFITLQLWCYLMLFFFYFQHYLIMSYFFQSPAMPVVYNLQVNCHWWILLTLVFRVWEAFVKISLHHFVLRVRLCESGLHITGSCHHLATCSAYYDHVKALYSCYPFGCTFQNPIWLFFQ